MLSTENAFKSGVVVCVVRGEKREAGRLVESRKIHVCRQLAQWLGSRDVTHLQCCYGQHLLPKEQLASSDISCRSIHCPGTSLQPIDIAKEP